MGCVSGMIFTIHNDMDASKFDSNLILDFLDDCRRFRDAGRTNIHDDMSVVDGIAMIMIIMCADVYD